MSSVGSWLLNSQNDPRAPERRRKLLAWTLIFLGLVSLVACISHFFTGRADQSVVEGLQGAGQARNTLGFAGAWIADLIVTRGFGVLGILLPLYGILVGLVVLEDDFYAFARRMLKYLLFVLLFGSVFISYVLILADSHRLDLGGGIGYWICTLLFSLIGKIGVAFLILFVVLAYAVINFNAEIRATQLISRLQDVSRGLRPPQGPARNRAALPPSPGATPASGLRRLLGAFFPATNSPVTEAAATAAPKKTARPAANSESIPPWEEAPGGIPGEQIELPFPAPKARSAREVTLDVQGGLELVIDEGEPEDKAAAPADTGVKEFIPLGADNIGIVKGDEARVEKIIEPEDQEIEIEDFEAFDPTRELSDYEQPPIGLLRDYGSERQGVVNREELEENKNKIVDTLKNYGIEIVSIKATVGPTVTLYEIVPAPGVRISRIRSLEDDIALSLAALGIRIIAPIPGKGTIGIEVPNSNPEVVSLKGLLASERFKNFKGELPVALGRTISNQVYVADLNKMPHLLIAGATGQGKSVGLNTVISSILFRKHPAEVKFVLIDPKKVEMSLYQALKFHYIAMMPNQRDAVITDVREAINVLKCLGVEMDQRYELLQKARVRNLSEYNNKFLQRKLNPRKGHYFMPYIVLVIDELADLMMVGGKEVELPIARLAQLARAIGIHLVVATQRPSVNVITGIIKANFPARLSYRVISKVDSRTILDANGADQLVGRGDMLLSTGSDLVRIQNAFIDTPEVEQLVDFIAEQRGFPEPYFLPDLPSEEGGEDGFNDEPFERDSMFDEAARMVVRYQLGSASLIQRKMKLGYNRAGRIVDQLERAGIVGPHSGSKAREVLITDEAELEKYLQSLG